MTEGAEHDRVELAWTADRSLDDVLTALGTTPGGLTAVEAARRLATDGPNVLADRTVTAFDVLMRQLRSPLLLLLVAAAVISAFTGGATDAGIIGTIVALSVGLGFFNEYRSERAVAALHDSLRHESIVWRDGASQAVDVRELVPGDVIELHLGDLVPADARVMEASHLECDEAVLTGESLPAVKDTHIGTDVTTTVSMGTIVHQGSGKAVVVGTGSRTAFGTIATGLAEAQAQTSFQVGLRSFSMLLVKVAAVLTTSIFVVNVVLSRGLLEAMLFSLAIAIGITPQLLPAIVSLSLATGARELAKRKVLVKRLVTIEDLGNIEILFTDKTGTLTEGAITFAAALDPKGGDDPSLLLPALLCDEATAGTVGNALDVALWAAPGVTPTMVDGHDRLAVLPFDHERQRAAALVRAPNGDVSIVVKGAPEAVLACCADLPAEASPTLERLFAEGARVVAVASRPATGTTLETADERDLRLLGFVTFVDRPKVDAAGSIARLESLGIEVKIITGDNGTVAATVCRGLGLEVKGVLTGAEVAALDDDALHAAIDTTTVFARVGPDQKARIVKVARRTGVDVAFLGDGVNDAVALHAADVGISVDTAADVAKDAADIVLLDKSLSVLADGVMEGRRIFSNTLKYVLMATSSNFGNMFSAAGASLFLTFLPDAPEPDPAQQPPLRRGPAVDPHRQRRRGGDATAGGMGHPIRPAVHDHLRPGEFAVRLRHVRRAALGVACEPLRVPHRMVRGEPGDPDAGHLRHPDAAHPVRAQQAQHRHPHHADRVRGRRRGAAVHPARARARVHHTPADVLPHPARHDRRLPRADRDGEGPLLRCSGAPATHPPVARAAPRTPRAASSQPVRDAPADRVTLFPRRTPCSPNRRSRWARSSISTG